jgi:isopentenyl phosphate kinase
MFNPATIETVQGKVADIKTTKGKKGMDEFERLDLKTDHGTMPVVLGPTSYVDKEKVKINKGDDISVTGSRVTMHKKQELVATQIKKGNDTLDLRKSDGTPLWHSNEKQDGK